MSGQLPLHLPRGDKLYALHLAIMVMMEGIIIPNYDPEFPRCIEDSLKEEPQWVLFGEISNGKLEEAEEAAVIEGLLNMEDAVID